MTALRTKGEIPYDLSSGILSQRRFDGDPLGL